MGEHREVTGKGRGEEPRIAIRRPARPHPCTRLSQVCLVLLLLLSGTEGLFCVMGFELIHSPRSCTLISSLAATSLANFVACIWAFGQLRRKPWKAHLLPVALTLLGAIPLLVAIRIEFTAGLHFLRAILCAALLLSMRCHLLLRRGGEEAAASHLLPATHVCVRLSQLLLALLLLFEGIAMLLHPGGPLHGGLLALPLLLRFGTSLVMCLWAFSYLRQSPWMAHLFPVAVTLLWVALAVQLAPSKSLSATTLIRAVFCAALLLSLRCHVTLTKEEEQP